MFTTRKFYTISLHFFKQQITKTSNEILRKVIFRNNFPHLYSVIFFWAFYHQGRNLSHYRDSVCYVINSSEVMMNSKTFLKSLLLVLLFIILLFTSFWSTMNPQPYFLKSVDRYEPLSRHFWPSFVACKYMQHTVASAVTAGIDPHDATCR